ncbi:MAG: nucleoside deaminase [Candidatus Gastranaerophilales bacterium]|nr:nucleoside deaminase [Candidatus Gastranaerophilales bacterium]
MHRARTEALKTPECDVPVGCIILCGDKVISSSHNTREKDCDVTSHAEINAIRKAQKELKRWHLDDCTMYVTLEPCPMCGWTILESRIKTLYFGSYNTRCGAFGTVLDLKQIANSSIKVYGGIDEKKCDKILEDFFKKLRELKGG